ncbi:MAG: hypothetical protein WCC04_00850 [Terriglobales bacterium]
MPMVPERAQGALGIRALAVKAVAAVEQCELFPWALEMSEQQPTRFVPINDLL